MSIEDNEVADDPIIWFIASLIALRCNSLNSSSVFEPSPPIIRSVIILTSFSFKTNKLLPSRPTVYAILIKTHGLSYSATKSSHVLNDTTGVEISTFRLTRENKVVAAVPILIFAISPIASFSESESNSPPSTSAELLPGSLSSALISSCDNTPSILYCSSLITEVILTAYLSSDEPGNAVNLRIFPT